ncbi:hypothetical protein CBS76997_8449 [Aspergillus niger]|nr:hypothetical protein CBS76997_8449 [Aspergillus niger]
MTIQRISYEREMAFYEYAVTRMATRILLQKLESRFLFFLSHDINLWKDFVASRSRGECFKHFDSDYKRLLPRYHKGSLSSDQHPARPYLPVDQWYEDTILSDTLSNTMAQPAESSVSYELTRKSHMGGECILKRFSQWFWSVWMIAGSGTHDALADPANHPRATNGASTKTNGCAGTARDVITKTHKVCFKMEAEYIRIAEAIQQEARKNDKKRLLVAIAGIPGSGKTTTASAVAQQLRAESQPNKIALISMDGFHLSRAALDTLPNREEAYIRRGAPWTFDAVRFVTFVQQLRQWADSTPFPSDGGSSSDATVIYAPSFDHEAKDPIENGMVVTSDASIIIIEGNYLLLNEEHWRDVSQLVDYRIFVDADLQEARGRVARRHVSAGIEKTLEDGFRRVDSNDYLNALHIQGKLIRPDMVVKSVELT